eukprot:jgi/Mesvir1/26098/Mv06817-RA.1
MFTVLWLVISWLDVPLLLGPQMLHLVSFLPPMPSGGQTSAEVQVLEVARFGNANAFLRAAALCSGDPAVCFARTRFLAGMLEARRLRQVYYQIEDRPFGSEDYLASAQGIGHLLQHWERRLARLEWHFHKWLAMPRQWVRSQGTEVGAAVQHAVVRNPVVLPPTEPAPAREPSLGLQRARSLAASTPVMGASTGGAEKPVPVVRGESTAEGGSQIVVDISRFTSASEYAAAAKTGRANAWEQISRVQFLEEALQDNSDKFKDADVRTALPRRFGSADKYVAYAKSTSRKWAMAEDEKIALLDSLLAELRGGGRPFQDAATTLTKMMYKRCKKLISEAAPADVAVVNGAVFNGPGAYEELAEGLCHDASSSVSDRLDNLRMLLNQVAHDQQLTLSQKLSLVSLVF